MTLEAPHGDGRGAACADLEATLNFIKPSMQGIPYIYACEPPPGVPNRGNWEELPVSGIPVRDMRPMAESLSLDVEGFRLVAHESEVADFYDDEEVRRIYYPECTALLTGLTGATEVIVFDHAVRSKKERAGALGTVPQMHNDYTMDTGARRVRDHVGEKEYLRWGAGRALIVNIWRPISGPLEDEPLALCDARTIAQEDRVTIRLHNSGGRIGESWAMRHNSRQRWHYASRMGRDEALVFKCYDSSTDGRARHSAHGAFIDPTITTPAVVRESIELRALLRM